MINIFPINFGPENRFLFFGTVLFPPQLAGTMYSHQGRVPKGFGLTSLTLGSGFWGPLESVR